MNIEDKIRFAREELERLEAIAKLGPLSFDEWAVDWVKRRNSLSGIVPINWYDQDPGYRYHVDANNERGFLPGENPVLLKGSRPTLIRNNPLSFVSELHRRLIRKERKTIIYSKEATDYKCYLFRRLWEYLVRKNIYCADRTFRAATEMPPIGVDRIYCDGYAHVLIKGKVLLLNNQHKIDAVKELFDKSRKLEKLAEAERLLAE